MKFGMNLLLWTADMKEEVAPVLEALKETGFDGVEIPSSTLTSTTSLGANGSTTSGWSEPR